MTTLVTGSTGFVGRHLVNAMHLLGHPVRAAVRAPNASLQASQVVIPQNYVDVDAWRQLMTGCDIVIHLLGRAHVMREVTSDPLTAFRLINTEVTTACAAAAVAEGVRRFVFVSSVKVNGESTLPGRPFLPQICPPPQDPYGLSKWEAEQALRELASRAGMELVIVRPPLVYGPGVRANFQSLVNAVRRGLPLPLANATRNRRSLVGVDNLVDLLLTCASHPAAAGQTFMASDGDDLSTADLLRRIGFATGRPARLWPMPLPLLQLGAKMLGRERMAQRLLDNLQVDICHTRCTLNWTPPLSVDEGLGRAVQPEFHDPQTSV